MTAPVVILIEEERLLELLHVLEVKLSPPALGAWLKEAVVPYLAHRAEDRFTLEGDDVVGKWLPLTDATIAIRQGLNFPGPHPINVRTGELEQYIIGDQGDIFEIAEGAQLTWPRPAYNSILEEKVATAQRGKDRTPPRPVLGINEQDLAFVFTALEAYVLAGIMA